MSKTDFADNNTSNVSGDSIDDAIKSLEEYSVHLFKCFSDMQHGKCNPEAYLGLLQHTRWNSYY